MVFQTRTWCTEYNQNVLVFPGLWRGGRFFEATLEMLHPTLPSLELIDHFLAPWPDVIPILLLVTVGRFQLQIPTIEVEDLPSHTVDGRNPPPVDMKYILFFYKQVVQDFFHQQYHFHHQFATISLACCNSQVLDSVPQEPRQRACDNLKWYLELKVMLLYLYKSQCAKIGVRDFRGPSWPDSRLIQMYTMKQSSVGLGKAHLTCKKPWNGFVRKHVVQTHLVKSTVSTSFDGGLRINRYWTDMHVSSTGKSRTIETIFDLVTFSNFG